MLSRPESVPLNISLTTWPISLAFRKARIDDDTARINYFTICYEMHLNVD